MNKKLPGPPQAPQKADFGRTTAKMGRFAQKGLCYSFEILQGLLSNKKIRNPMKKIFGESPINPILTGKWGNLVKSTLQTSVPENFR